MIVGKTVRENTLSFFLIATNCNYTEHTIATAQY